METQNEIINKYIDDPNYIIQGGLYNVNDFNKAYNIMKEHRKKISQDNDLTYLNQLTEKENIKHISIYNQNISDIMINLKNTINDILNDLIIDIVHLRFNINIFFKDGRMFYLGLIFIIIGLLLYIFNLLFDKN
jgi:hypothetical protein